MMTRRTCVVACAALAIAACSPDELLQVDNPEEIQIGALDDVKLLPVQLNGVVDQFESSYTSPVLEYANFLTDEVLTGLNWEDYRRVNQRVASYLEGPTAGIFEGLSKGLRMGHNLAERIRAWQEEYPDENFDEELATALIYAGYSATVLAENMCQAVVSPDPDNPSSEVLEQLETFAVAIPYFEEGLEAARRANDADLENLALVGLARANLGAGNWAAVITAAQQVGAGFGHWIDHVDIDNGRNPLQGTSHGGNFTHGIHPWFMGAHPSFAGTGYKFTDDNVRSPQTDPRIQHEVTDRVGHDGATRLYKLFQGLRFSDYSGKTIAPASASCPDCTGTSPADMPLLTEYDTDILMADYLEAQHHMYEAMAMQGGNDAAILAFVNARRAVGNQAPVALSGQALRQELRNQRARDLFMGGFRLPDLRRWTRFDAGNGPFDGGSYFPTGTLPPGWTQFDSFGAWTCFPIPLSEYEGNPNLTKPVSPNTPPGI